MAFTQDAGCQYASRSHCLYRINVHVPLPRMPEAGSPDKIIGIILWLLLRTPDAGSPSDAGLLDKVIVFEIFMLLLPRTPDAELPYKIIGIFRVFQGIL